MIVAGETRVPGDKSITHRALLFAAMGRGTSYLGGALTSLDARSSASVLRRLGAPVSPLVAGRVVRIEGRGRFSPPTGVLHCGNSGTTTRLLLGLLAAHRFPVTLTGDASLRRRPMRRVTVPLAMMGARIVDGESDGLPLTIRGGRLTSLRYELPVSSAQIKSCLLLAAMAGKVPVSLREPHGRSRDHTERMLRGFGFTVNERDGWIEFSPDSSVPAFDMQVPGDPSSAAFLLGAALLAEAGSLAITGVGLNPTRIGFLSVLAGMGGTVAQEKTHEEGGEPVGTLTARPSDLRGVEVGAAEIPGLIDEIPLLAILASRARGTTIFREAGELRVKESDRLGLLAANLRAVGSQAEVRGEDLWIEGGEIPPAGRVKTAGDHRLAMAFAVLGTVPGAGIRIDDLACAEVSFPGFGAALRSIRARRSRG
ncbi:MAG: 3-phosphoshikimate 1-carboxyvinyltransferase [Gemmatimonadota bacterium]